VLRYLYTACLVLLHSLKIISVSRKKQKLLKRVYSNTVATHVTKAAIELRWKWYFELHTNYLLMVYCKLCMWKGVDFPINVSKQFSSSFAHYNHFIYKIETKFAE